MLCAPGEIRARVVYGTPRTLCCLIMHAGNPGFVRHPESIPCDPHRTEALGTPSCTVLRGSDRIFTATPCQAGIRLLTGLSFESQVLTLTPFLSSLAGVLYCP